MVLIVVAVIVMGLFLGKIVKAGMETIGPKITQTTLTVDAVDVSMLTGSAKVKNLVIGNPEGFKAPNAISVALAAVSVSPMSVLSDKIVVRSVRVESPEITFEGNPFGANNLKKIQDNVNAAAANFQSPLSTNQPPKTAAPAKPGAKLEVDDFLITGAKVHIGTGATLPLPDIHLTGLGNWPGRHHCRGFDETGVERSHQRNNQSRRQRRRQYRQGRRQDSGRGSEQNHIGPGWPVQEVIELIRGFLFAIVLVILGLQTSAVCS